VILYNKKFKNASVFLKKMKKILFPIKEGNSLDKIRFLIVE